MENDSDDLTNLRINVENVKWAIIGTTQAILFKLFPQNAEALSKKFVKEYEDLLNSNDNELMTDFEKLKKVRKEYARALEKILNRDEVFNVFIDSIDRIYNMTLLGARRKARGEIRHVIDKGPILPGTDKSTDIVYFCSVCKQEFEIEPEEKKRILNSDEKLELKTHCGSPVKIKIIRKAPEKIKLLEKTFSEERKEEQSETKHSTEIDSKEYMTLLSVGIDVGSSTSHLVFSRLSYQRERNFLNMTNRFHLTNREIIYEGKIIDTPLLDRFTIDIEKLISFFQSEYKRAGIKKEMVNSGAVIITGETAKKKNAEEIVQRLSSESGKFVSATAGPNFESYLAAMGSGIVSRSEIDQKTYMNVDVGGGTSNLAIASCGDVLSTACINIGGRLLGVDKNYKITRIDEPTEFIMQQLGLSYQVGDTISEGDIQKIVKTYAEVLIEVLLGPAKSTIAKKLMMTEDLDYSVKIDGFSFSGGVAEYIYGKETIEYDDIGKRLAKEIKKLIKEKDIPLIEPENTIRATVIGAGSFSLTVSGSTCYVDRNLNLPIKNIPVIKVNLNKKEFSIEKTKKAIHQAYLKFDMKEGEDIVALFFDEPIYRSEYYIKSFAKALETSFANSISNNKLIILIFKEDIGGTVGLTLKRETSLQNNFMCLDEIELEEGDWIDIGEPLYSGQVYPVTVKSLVFNLKK
ncbi:MAG: ethanolamine ammonia-lyase reactivating factor EutA [Candidatus Heimdallarchaeaceae archaeon]